MEIARLEVSTQQHLDRMQETAKVNYVQYGKSTKSKKGKKSTQSGASGSSHRGDRGHGMSSKPSGKGRKLPFPQDTCYRCGKGRHQKVQDCKALDAVCRGCGKKGHFEKVCLKGKHSTHSLEVPQASTSTAGAGASEPLYFDNEGQSVYIYMVSVPHVNKHLIKFPIALDYSTLRGRNKMEYSTGSTGHSNCSTMHSSQQNVLLKADTGADVNLMNRKTFNQLFGEAKVLQPTPIRMENYGKYSSESTRDVPCISEVEGQDLQLFYITDCDRSPNLLSRDASYTLGVLKPCYTVQNSTDSTDSTHASNKGDLVAKSFLHQKMKESERKLSNYMIIYGRSDLEHDKHLINFLEVCRKNTLTLNPDKMQFRLPQVFLLWTPVECQGAQSRSKENCSSEKDEFTSRCGDNEKFPWTC